MMDRTEYMLFCSMFSTERVFINHLILQFILLNYWKTVVGLVTLHRLDLSK